MDAVAPLSSRLPTLQLFDLKGQHSPSCTHTGDSQQLKGEAPLPFMLRRVDIA